VTANVVDDPGQRWRKGVKIRRFAPICANLSHSGLESRAARGYIRRKKGGGVMAIPIAPTPFLTGKSARRLEKIMEENSRKPKKKLVMHPVDFAKIQELMQNYLAGKPEK